MSSLVEWQSWVRSPQTLLRQIGIGIFRFELKLYRLLVCCKTAKFNVILWISNMLFQYDTVQIFQQYFFIWFLLVLIISIAMAQTAALFTTKTIKCHQGTSWRFNPDCQAFFSFYKSDQHLLKKRIGTSWTRTTSSQLSLTLQTTRPPRSKAHLM